MKTKDEILNPYLQRVDNYIGDDTDLCVSYEDALEAIEEYHSQFSELTDEKIKEKAKQHAIKIHGTDEAWQPDRSLSIIDYMAGAKFVMDYMKGDTE